MPYIKSHSNYVIKKKHQSVNDGTIYERDITTIGGRDNFAPGQTPLYQSGNFVITVNNDDNVKQSFLSDKWEKNNESGETWNLRSLSKVLSGNVETNEGNDEIVLKKDYYDLSDYAYYGSCSELIRASINDILNKYPGELYFAIDDSVEGSLNGLSVYYTDNSDYNGGDDTANYEEDSGSTNFTLTKIKKLGDDNCFLVDNPFDINLYNDIINEKELEGKNSLRYFANGGYSNYSFIDPSGNSYTITGFEVKYPSTTEEYVSGKTYDKIIVESSNHVLSGNPNSISVNTLSGNSYITVSSYDENTYAGVIYPNMCIGKPYCVIDLSISGNSEINNIELTAYTGNEYKIYYLASDTKLLGSRIRPKAEYLTNFFSNLDNFEKILLNKDSNPIYTAVFNVKRENEEGYFTELEYFTFPTTYGGYNLGSNGPAFDDYVGRLADVADFYDERFSDNMYRSLTHESIKNFDWTYNKHKSDSDEEDIEESGNKVADIIRLWGREFDEIMSYATAIKNYNAITYDNIDNLPDYFFSDILENDGWDLKQIIPYKLYEYSGSNKNADVISATSEQELSNKIGNSKLNRIFSQDSAIKIVPYPKDKKFPEGYFDTCSCNTNSYVRLDAKGSGETYIDECANLLRFKIKTYSSDKEWTMQEVNNQFLKRLILNSKNIWRHKGVQDGVEMLLGLFNLKSRRWLESYNPKNALDYDYEIKEYTSFAKRIEDKYIDDIEDFKFDWVNKRKDINYNNGEYVPYQGLPVIYREVNENGIRKRYLYPDFDKDAKYDSDFYYQMNGGWLSVSPYLFDNDDNLVVKENDENIYQESLRGVKSVANLNELFGLPSETLLDGDIYFVENLSGSYAIVDGKVYEIKQDSDGISTYYYITETVNNGTMYLGNASFSDNCVISDPFSTDNKARYDFSDGSYDGMPIKIYILKEGNERKITAYSNTDSVATFTIFENGKYMKGSGYTHYFRINDSSYSNELSLLGWEQLKDTDYDYYKVNAQKNYYNGNNPHTGHLHYDNGHEYFLYYKNLFRYPLDNDLFNTSALSDYPNYEDENLYNDIENYGFSGLISSDECDTNYDKYLTEDSKIHYFGNYIHKNEYKNNKYEEYRYTDDVAYDNSYYNYNLSDINPLSTTAFLSLPGKTYGQNNENQCYDSGDTSFKDGIDYVTNQIVNTKVVKVNFQLRDDNFTSHSALSEMKYLQSIVVPYMTQMMPSGAILATDYYYKGQKVNYYTIKVIIDGELADNIPLIIDGNDLEYTSNGYYTIMDDASKNIVNHTVKIDDSFLSSSTLSVGTASLSFDYTGGTQDIDVYYSTRIVKFSNGISANTNGNNCIIFSGQSIDDTSNHELSIKYDDWLNVDSSDIIKGISSTIIVFANTNSKEAARNGRITYTYNGLSAYTDIEQAYDDKLTTYTVYTNASDNAVVTFIDPTSANTSISASVKNGVAQYSRRHFNAPSSISFTISSGLPESSSTYSLYGDETDYIIPNNGQSGFTPNLSGICDITYATWNQTGDDYTSYATGVVESDGDVTIDYKSVNASIVERIGVKGISVNWISATALSHNKIDCVNVTKNSIEASRSTMLTYYLYNKPTTTLICKINQEMGSYTFEWNSKYTGPSDKSFVFAKSDKGKKYRTMTIDYKNHLAGNNIIKLALNSIKSYGNTPSDLIPFTGEANYTVNSNLNKIRIDSSAITIECKKNTRTQTRSFSITFTQDNSNKKLFLDIIQTKVVCEIGDVYCYNSSDNYYSYCNITATTADTLDGTPIGVVVIPWNGSPSNSNPSYARIISIDDLVSTWKNVTYVRRGGYAKDNNRRDDYDDTSILSNPGSRVGVFNLERQHLLGGDKGKQSWACVGTKEPVANMTIKYSTNGLYYNNTDRHVPSQFLSNNQNKIDASNSDNHFMASILRNGQECNCFTDFNGYAQAQALYTRYNLSDAYTQIRLYHTTGTKAKDWFIGSIGEMAAVCYNLKKINKTLTALLTSGKASKTVNTLSISKGYSNAGFRGDKGNYYNYSENYWSCTYKSNVDDGNDETGNNQTAYWTINFGDGQVSWAPRRANGNKTKHLVWMHLRPMLLANENDNHRP